MKKLRSIFILVFITVFLQQCSTDFDLNAPYKDIMVVYGLLNQNDSTHYIKVNKAFLGEDDALVMAQNPANSNYQESIEVKIQQWKFGLLQKEFILDTLMIHDKDPGIFYNPDQLIYKFDEYRLDEESEYKLIITNKNTGKVVNSQTNLIKKFNIETPNSGQSIIGFTAIPTKYVKWTSAEFGRLYEVNIKLNYYEKDLITNQIDSSKSIIWYLGSKRSTNTDGGENMEVAYIGENFFNNARAKIPVDQNKRRVAGKVEFCISVAADDYAVYMDVNGPSNSIVQDKPEYTNISNGIGLFSSRYDNSIDRSRTYSLEFRTLDSLVIGSITHDLGFSYTF